MPNSFTLDEYLWVKDIMTFGLDPEVKCIGCGHCCIDAPCGSGETVWRDGHEWCNSLVWKDGRYWCELALNSAIYYNMHGCGKGCLNPYNKWRYDMLGSKIKSS